MCMHDSEYVVKPFASHTWLYIFGSLAHVKWMKWRQQFPFPHIRRYAEIFATHNFNGASIFWSLKIYSNIFANVRGFPSLCRHQYLTGAPLPAHFIFSAASVNYGTSVVWAFFCPLSYFWFSLSWDGMVLTARRWLMRFQHLYQGTIKFSTRLFVTIAPFKNVCTYR